MKVVVTTLNAKYIHSSLGLRYVKIYCEPQFAVECMEFTINQDKQLILSDIYQAQPDVIGFASYIWNADAVLEIAQMVRQVLPHAVIVFGGPEVMYETAEFFCDHPFVDYLVLGEGEEAFAGLLAALASGRAVEVPGVLGRREGNVAEIQSIADLTTIPFPYTDADMAELKTKIIYYETSRGCPFSCQYCLSGGTKGVRFLPLDRVKAELDFFVRHNVRQVKFVDRTFNAKKSHYVPILEYILTLDCDTNFHFEVAADLLDDEVLDILARMPKGRVQLEIGVQSTHEPTLAKVQRKNHWDKIVHAVHRLQATGNIHLHLDLIIGLPEEGYERFGQSFEEVYALQPDMLQIGFLKLLKGSGLRRQADVYGYAATEKAPYLILASKWITYSEVRHLHILEEVFEQIYNSGKMKTALHGLIELYGRGAFAFYRDLTNYWEAQGWHRVAHNTKSLYTNVYRFCESVMPKQKGAVRALLMFNALLLEKGNIQPEVFGWQERAWENEQVAFWHNEAIVKKYLTHFVFKTWRELQRTYRIEVFDYAVQDGVMNGILEEKRTVVLFCYGTENTWQIIDEADFWQEEADVIS